jgi:integrase
MTGHVRRRGERSWELKFDLGTDPATGRRRIRYASFKGTKRDAEIELAKLVAAAAKGEQVDVSKSTLSEFLDRWERDWCGTNVSPKTSERYRELLRLHVRPHIGAVRIQKLRATNLTELYGKLAPRLAPRTIGHVHRVIFQALSHAVNWDVISSNVAARVTPPRVAQEEIEILTASAIKAILDKSRGRPIYQIATLALATGMRRGELLALRWQDLDLDAGRITVARSLEQTATGLRFKEPKTRHGRRTFGLPPSAVDELRQHWKAQQELRLALGAGKAPPSALVFSDVNGNPRRPDVISQTWRKTAKAAKVRATFHSLRHTHASHLIAAGLDVLTISRRLGHASPTITLSVYGHLFPQSDDRAAQAIEAALSSTE